MALVDQAKEWKREYVADLAFKFVLFILTAVITPLTLAFVYSVNTKLSQHEQDAATLRSVILVLQENVAASKQFQDLRFSHMDASLDAAKSQIRELTAEIRASSGKLELVRTSTAAIATQLAKKNRPKHAKR